MNNKSDPMISPGLVSKSDFKIFIISGIFAFCFMDGGIMLKNTMFCGPGQCGSLIEEAADQ